MRQISILGTRYTIEFRNEKDDKLLDDKCRDGYMDPSLHMIVICNKTEECELGNFEEYKKTVLRHEIVHAFLYESGLDASSNSTLGAWTTNEEMVDWFAIQSPKIFKIFQELGIA